jgi:hypothetical protein
LDGKSWNGKHVFRPRTLERCCRDQTTLHEMQPCTNILRLKLSSHLEQHTQLGKGAPYSSSRCQEFNPISSDVDPTSRGCSFAAGMCWFLHKTLHMTNLSPSTRQHLIAIESSPRLIFKDIQSFELNRIDYQFSVRRRRNGIPTSNKLHLTSITPPRQPHHHHCNKQNINRTNEEIRNGTSYSSLVSALSSFHSTGHHPFGPK